MLLVFNLIKLLNPMKTTVLSTFALIIMLTTACKKYPEGPGLSLQSKARRIEGTYQVKQFTANGTDMLSFYTTGSLWTNCSTNLDYSEGYRVTSYEWKFTKGGNVSTSQATQTQTLDVPNSLSTCTLWYDYSTSASSDAGTWSLVRDKEYMKLQFGNSVVEAEILELRDKQIQLRWTDAGTLYNLTLEE